MPYQIKDLRLHIEQDEKLLKKKAAKQLGVGEDSILSLRILKESIDARDKRDIFFHYTLEASLFQEEKLSSTIKSSRAIYVTDKPEEPIIPGTQPLHHRPVVVGTGPAGLFAGLQLARAGYRPILLERGSAMEERDRDVAGFWQSGLLKADSNVQFGEGGAGTYSDGKLTTRIKDSRCETVLNELIQSGAPEDIRYAAKAHIGTDLLKGVVVNIRREILSLGGEFLFNSRLCRLVPGKEGIYRLYLSTGVDLAADCVVLAVGHSARDTYIMLREADFPITPKPFALGLRIEHSQQWLDRRQYGAYAGHPRLGAADYKLTHQDRETGRGVYSFCMCPGGLVVAAASEEGRLVTNGMSYHARDGVNANSAVVASISVKDFPDNDPLSGAVLQQHWEHQAYLLGGSNYKAPAQRLEDFLNQRPSQQFGQISPTYCPGVIPANLWQCLPEPAARALTNGIRAFDRKIPGFAHGDAVLTGVETRTSAPIRMEREADLQVKGFPGIYTAGEGAGYAGGIISAAVDGLKAAISVISKYKS